jgi:hypothetical protein
MPSEGRVGQFFKDLGLDLSKKALGRIIESLFGLLLLPMLGNIIAKLAQLDHSPALDEYPGLTLRGAIEVWTVLVPYLYAEAWRHPTVSLLCLALLIGFVILYFALARARRRLREQGRKLNDAALADGLISRSGLAAHWPHARPEGGDQGASWDDLRAEIARPDNTFVSILGANGAETFGRANSPLYETLERFRHQIRIILAHPDGLNSRARAADLGVNEEEYRNEVRQSVDRLRTLRQRGHRVSGRYYFAKPNWKMIITPRTMWLQYYEEGGQHVANTAVYRFDATGGLYHCFMREFERIWDRCEQDAMDLGGPINHQPIQKPAKA